MRLGLALLLVSTATAHADDVVAKVLAFYDASPHWSGTFKQETTTHQPDQTTKRTGTIVLARGGKLRVDTAKPNETLIADGASFWFVNHHARVVQRKREQDSPVAALGLFVAGQRVHDEFTTKVDTASDALTIHLEPVKKSRWIAHVTWIVDPKDFHVREATVVDDGGNAERMMFDKLDSKPAVKDAVFAVDRKAKPLRSYSYDQLD